MQVWVATCLHHPSWVRGQLHPQHSDILLLRRLPRRQRRFAKKFKSEKSEKFPEFLEDGVVIDGRCSIDGDHGFVDVRLDTTLGEEGVSTTQELNRCKKTVLVFYLNFLKVVRDCL